jgi:hypothetical protein
MIFGVFAKIGFFCENLAFLRKILKKWRFAKIGVFLEKYLKIAFCKIGVFTRKIIQNWHFGKNPHS